MSNSLSSPAGPEPDKLGQLLAAFELMKEEMTSQRQALEKRVAELESELAGLRARPALAGSPAGTAPLAATKTTTRRRMLRQLVAGTAGTAAAVGLLAAAQPPAAQAAPNVMVFNGDGQSATNNIASGTTTIVTTPGAFTSAVPLLKLDNSYGSTGSGSNPDSLPIGLYARSSNGFAIYGYTSAGVASTAIIGVSGSSTLLTGDTFFASEVGGVVGASDSNVGAIGMSANAPGVRGISGSTYGVQGVSENNIGGGFGSAATNINRGAAIHLGVRTDALASGPPSATAYSHNAGEIYLDNAARMFLCQAGYQSISGAATVNNGLPTGVLNPLGANWRQIPPMVIKSTNPDTPFTRDQELHVRGELWINESTGATFLCTATGAYNNSNMKSAGNAAFPLPTFVQVGGGGGGGFTVLSTPARIICTIPGYVAGTVVSSSVGGTASSKMAAGETRVYQITSNGGPVPTGATAITASITSVNIDMTTGQTGYFTFWANGNRPSVSQVTYNVPGVANAGTFTTSLDLATGQLSVFTLRAANIIIDVAGYYH